MTLLLLGDATDARGFRFAGVEAVACRTRDDVEKRLEAVTSGASGPVAAVFVSEAARRLAPVAVNAAMDRAVGPIIVMLPGR